jgi:hypothetical protein
MQMMSAVVNAHNRPVCTGYAREHSQCARPDPGRRRLRTGLAFARGACLVAGRGKSARPLSSVLKTHALLRAMPSAALQLTLGLEEAITGTAAPPDRFSQ